VFRAAVDSDRAGLGFRLKVQSFSLCEGVNGSSWGRTVYLLTEATAQQVSGKKYSEYKVSIM
jgi:hypothetical protein